MILFAKLMRAAVTPVAHSITILGGQRLRSGRTGESGQGSVMDLSRLIEGLSDPAAFSHPVGSVEVRQTHISVVFLAGPFVYKIKKPVNPGFLDFTTLEKRHHYCQEEVRLNRRLAPGVYLGVVPVVQFGTNLRFEGEGQPVEWAVKMRRLPDEATLQHLLERGLVDVALVEALARKVAAFHVRAESRRKDAFGTFDDVAGQIQDVLDRAAASVGTTMSPSVFARIRALTEEALGRLRPLIESRAQRGVTRDCHGDLRLDHVYFFPEAQPPDDLIVIDCIEFNERFRFIDPVADMAFTVMDFAFHGRRDMGNAFRETYFRATGDDDGRVLLPLYTAYRAAVRGMVEGLVLGEKELSEADHAQALEQARAHWLLALSELEPPGRKPCLVLVGGLPGTGKSRLARGLAETAGFSVIRSDVVRKELAGLSEARSREDLYTPESTERTYTECLARARSLLFSGGRVLVDATFRAEDQRRRFLDAARRWGVPACVLVCQASPDTVRQRLKDRRGDASDADWSVYQKLATDWEPTRTVPGLIYTISTEGLPEEVVSLGREAIRQAGLHD